MFLRHTKRKKDGKEHRYWSIVENRRIGRGRVVQRPLLYLGEINDSQELAWRKSIAILEEGALQPRTLSLFPEDRCEGLLPDSSIVRLRLNELRLCRPRQWGMAAPDLVENGDRPQARNAFEQRYHLAVPNRGQWIPPSAATRRSLLRREPEILLHAIGAGGAEPGLGRGDARRLGLADSHVQPHLAVGDVAPGQAVVPHRREEPASYPAGRDRQPTRDLSELRIPVCCRFRERLNKRRELGYGAWRFVHWQRDGVIGLR